MFITTHAAVGAIIAQHTSSPWLAFLLSFLSHFILDFIPHGDQSLSEKGLNKKLVLVSLIDFLGLIGFLFFVYKFVEVSNLTVVLFAILGSITPDLITHFFPVLHQQYPDFLILKLLNWLKNKSGLNRFIKLQDKIHEFTHNEILRYQIPFLVGLVLQFLVLGYCLKILS